MSVVAIFEEPAQQNKMVEMHFGRLQQATTTLMNSSSPVHIESTDATEISLDNFNKVNFVVKKKNVYLCITMLQRHKTLV